MTDAGLFHLLFFFESDLPSLHNVSMVANGLKLWLPLQRAMWWPSAFLSYAIGAYW